ncbi:MAG: glycerol-3-phosphate acyltransferase [Actinomycetota bacterium]|nr:glycerol-3-phosphate acyltransferase [Actinomycetota bacterium]
MAGISNPILYWPLLLVGAYLLGSVPFAQVIAKAKGVDLREVGTRNVGAGNLTREVGAVWGTIAAILDGLKGLLPVWLARKAGLGLGAAGIAGLAAVVGHNWSIWLRSRSGRGMAPSVGLILALDPVLLVWAGGWAVAGWKIGGGLGGFLGWGLMPIVAVALGRPATETLFLALLSIVLIGRRMQGNVDDIRGSDHAFRRALYDVDEEVPGELPGSAEDPLAP